MIGPLTGDEARAYRQPPAAASAATAVKGVVSIANFAFTPKIIEIASGDRVTWRNDDDVPHRIQSTTSAFAPSAVLDTKATYEVRMPTAGRFEYFCSLHPMMTGSIVVR